MNRPTLFCNSLIINDDGVIVDYQLRQHDGKRHVAIALKYLGYKVVAIGDSYNYTTMLGAADEGILFRPPEKIKMEFPDYPAIEIYEDLKVELGKYL